MRLYFVDLFHIIPFKSNYFILSSNFVLQIWICFFREWFDSLYSEDGVHFMCLWKNCIINYFLWMCMRTKWRINVYSLYNITIRYRHYMLKISEYIMWYNWFSLMSSSGITVKTLFGYSFPDGFKGENFHLIIEIFQQIFFNTHSFKLIWNKKFKLQYICLKLCRININFRGNIYCFHFFLIRYSKDHERDGSRCEQSSEENKHI